MLPIVRKSTAFDLWKEIRHTSRQEVVIYNEFTMITVSRGRTFVTLVAKHKKPVAACATDESSPLGDYGSVYMAMDLIESWKAADKK